MTDGDLLKEDGIKGLRLKSYKDKYVLIDNLETRGEPSVYTYSDIYNKDYVFIFVVLHGTMHLIINNKLTEVHSNDCIIIHPFMHIEILESRCIVMGAMLYDEIIEDIYEHSGIGASVGIKYYSFYHFHLDKNYIEILVNDYNLIRIEQERISYNMKEMTLRSFYTSFLAHLYSFANDNNRIVHSDSSKSGQFYNKFLELLSLFCKKERSVQFYANKMGITSKYLSTIAYSHCGHTASVMIDNYVTYRIKQMLYSGNLNIKQISEHCNFPNQSFFGRFFKRTTGVSPHDYQTEHNRKSIIEP